LVLNGHLGGEASCAEPDPTSWMRASCARSTMPWCSSSAS